MVGENEAPDLLKDRNSAIPRFEVLAPQPASPVCTASHIKAAQNRAVPHGFADLAPEAPLRPVGLIGPRSRRRP